MATCTNDRAFGWGVIMKHGGFRGSVACAKMEKGGCGVYSETNFCDGARPALLEMIPTTRGRRNVPRDFVHYL